MFAIFAFAGLAFAEEAAKPAERPEIPVYTKENITQVTAENKSVIALAVNRAHEGIESIKKSFKSMIERMEKKFKKVKQPEPQEYEYVIYYDDAQLVPEIVIWTGDEITSRHALELAEVQRRYEKEMRKTGKRILDQMKAASKIMQKQFEQLLGEPEQKKDAKEEGVKETHAEKRVRILKEKLARAEAAVEQEKEAKRVAAEKAAQKAAAKAEKAAQKEAAKAEKAAQKEAPKNAEL